MFFCRDNSVGGLLAETRAFKDSSCCWWVFLVFMIPSSLSNPELIRNREFETLFFFILLLFFFLLQAGESCGGLHNAGGRETQELWYLSFYLCFFFSWNCGSCENSLFRIIPGLAGDPCLGINYSGPNPCVAAGAIVTPWYTLVSSIFHQKNTHVWIWVEYAFWHWSFV
jgi:hypothetical protein